VAEPGVPSFIAQLKQRHVFRVAAMYAVTSWLLMQLGSVTFEPLGFPAWSQRALIILVAVGFPIALVLAWVFDVTPQGVVRTDARPTTGLSRGRKLDIVIIVVLLAALAVTFVWRREPTPVPTVAQDSSIAVLPFVAMSEDASLRHLAEGLSEQITNELAQRSELRVASRTSAFEQAGKETVAIAQHLGISYVLEGSVRPSGDKVRVTAQLVRGQDGLHVWSDTYDVAEADAAAWDQTAASVAVNANSYMALERELQHARTFTTNAEAYEHYAAARRLGWQQVAGGTAIPKPLDQMLGELDRAIALDPDFFSAHRYRGWLFLNKLDRGAACGNRCIDEARRSVDRALALRPDDPDALRLLAAIQLTNELDPAASQATLERVREIDPTNQSLNRAFAFLALFRGNAQDARDYLVRQLQVTPYVAMDHFSYGLVLLGIGDLDGADREVTSALRLMQRGEAFGIAGIHIYLLLRRGQIDEAKAEFAPLWARYRYTQPERLVQELASLGYEREARELTAKLSQQSDVDPFWVFQAYYGLGQYDDALVWLRRVVDGRDSRGPTVLRMPSTFPGLEEQPGYAELQKYLDSIQRSR
jgi:TolB-like protein